jgi:Undecaprenyl-phosphate glucose phosphotransferase
VVIALPITELHALKALMDRLSLETVDVRVVPDLYSYATLGRGIEEFAGLPIVSLQDAPIYGWNSVLKRCFDVLFSLTVLVGLAPLLALIALSVRLTSKGPIFYRQERMGLDGRLFGMYKFRTMLVNAEAAGAQMAARDDPRRTFLGTWLRRLSLDELPQFVNVLLGEMSVVGPRPERPSFIDAFKQQIPKYHLRHKMKAGVTGWAQIHGLRGQTSIATRIEYDLYYIEHWSLMLDLKIVVRTIFGGFLSKNAY